MREEFTSVCQNPNDFSFSWFIQDEKKRDERYTFFSFYMVKEVSKEEYEDLKETLAC